MGHNQEVKQNFSTDIDIWRGALYGERDNAEIGDGTTDPQRTHFVIALCGDRDPNSQQVHVEIYVTSEYLNGEIEMVSVPDHPHRTATATCARLTEIVHPIYEDAQEAGDIFKFHAGVERLEEGG